MTKEQLQERAQLVRIHEANCQIQYPSPIEANFRLAIMKKLATEYSLKELRQTTIAPPAGSVPNPSIQQSNNPPIPSPALRLAKRHPADSHQSNNPQIH